MSNLLINEPPLQVLPTLAKAIGLSEAIVLQQVHFWLGISKNERYGLRWVYKTYPEWQEEFKFWSVDSVGRIIRNLEDKELLIGVSWFNRMPTDRTKWYTIDYWVLSLYDIMPIPSWQNATMEAGKMPQTDHGKTTPSNHREENTPIEIDPSPTKPLLERHFGMTVSGSTLALWDFLAESYSVAWFEDALKETVNQGGGQRMNIKYVRAILENWKLEGHPNSRNGNGRKQDNRPVVTTTPASRRKDYTNVG